MKIDGKRILLRTPKASDARDIQKRVNDRDVSKYLAVVPYPYSMHDALEFIKNCNNRKDKKTHYSLGIIEREEKELIGVISLRKIDFKNRRAEIGYWIGKDHWRQGYGSEALDTILKYAFNDLKLNKIYAQVIAPNKPSYKLLEKKGFKREGIFKKQEKKGNKFLDVYAYGLLKEDYKK